MLFKKSRKSFRLEVEPEDVLLDSQSEQKNLGGLNIELKSGPLLFLLVTGIILFFSIFARVFYISILKNDEYHTQAEDTLTYMSRAQAPRGIFFDSTGQALVQNYYENKLIIYPTKILHNSNKDEIVTNLASILGVNGDELAAKIATATSYFLLPDVGGISSDGLLQFSAHKELFSGVSLQQTLKRKYLPGVSNVLGYLSQFQKGEYNDKYSNNGYLRTDLLGREGLEKFYEDTLRGISGELDSVVDSKGNVLSESVVKEPIDGQSIQLNIDYGLQIELRTDLAAALDKSKTPMGAAIAINPQTGAVLAMVSLPDYDNNAPSSTLNRAIAGLYPSGSIVKPLEAVAGLEEGLITSSGTVNCTGAITVSSQWGSQIFKDWKTHGITDLYKAIAQSCDTYFYILGGGLNGSEGLGIDRIKKYLDDFGLSSTTGIDLPGEQTGNIPDAAWKAQNVPGDPIWRIGDTYNLSIGQGYMQITPLEMIMALSSVANGGNLYEPEIASAFVDGNLNVIQKIEPKIKSTLPFSAASLAASKEGMRQCVATSGGSCRALQSLPVTAGGKTGTAEIGKTGFYQAWFYGFAPFDNPQIAIIILGEKSPAGGDIVGEGVAKQVFQWYFANRVVAK